MNFEADLPLLDAVEMEILMHRDAHFGGNFPIMIEYYEQEGVGVMDDFDVDQIQYLAEVERQYECDLAEALLPPPAKEKIQQCRELYKGLRSVYENKEAPPSAQRIADLILSEDEEPESEIKAVVRLGESAFQPLIDLLQSTTFDDPLSPGYGRGPLLAARCLGRIGNPKAIPFLFEAFGRHDFTADEAIISAFLAMEEPSKEFLMKRLILKPFTKENENAASLLSNFAEDAVVAHQALELLEIPETLKHNTFSTYLIFICAGLNLPEDQARFVKLADNPLISDELKFEINSIKSIWIK